MFAAELAEAAAKGQSGDAGVGVDAHGRRQAESLRSRVEFSKVGARLRARHAARGIDLDRFHPRYVDHHAGVADRTAANVVAAGTNGDEQVSRSGEVDGRSDVVGAGTIDHGRRSAIDHAVPHFPRLVVAGIAGGD